MLKADALGRRTRLADPSAPLGRSPDHRTWSDQLQPHDQPPAQACGLAADQLCRGCRGPELQHPGGTTGRSPSRRTSVRLGQCWNVQPADGLRRRPARRRHALAGDHHRPIGDGVLPRVHGPRQGLCALLHLSCAVQQFDAGADHQPKPSRDLRLLGAGGHVFLPAGRLLVRP